MKELWKKWVIKCGGTFYAVSMPFIAVMFILAAIGSCGQVGNGHGRVVAQPKPVREATEERKTIRQDVSDIWHYAKCALKFCDEDGRCPVWSTEYRKCYMLDKEGVKLLKAFVKFGCSKDEFESGNICF